MNLIDEMIIIHVILTHIIDVIILSYHAIQSCPSFLTQLLETPDAIHSMFVLFFFVQDSFV